MPTIALNRMVKYQGNNTKTVLIVSYGNRDYDDTLKELLSFVENKGFSCVAAIAAVAEHSIMHQFAKGRPDETDQKELIDFSKKILEKINGNTVFEKFNVPGNFPYREYRGGASKTKN